MKLQTTHNAGDSQHPREHSRLARTQNYIEYVTIDDNTVTTTNLQAALTAAAANQCALALPPGTHTLTGDVTAPAGIVGIIGNGAKLTGGALILDTDDGDHLHVTVRDLTVAGIRCTGDGVVSLCRFINLDVNGAAFAAECEFYRNRFESCHFHDANYGLHFADGHLHAVNTWQSCAFSGHSEAGVYFDNSSGVGGTPTATFRDCTFEGNRKYGFRANRTQNLRVEGCHFESNNLDKVGACDVLLENAGLHFTTEFISFVNTRWHYDLGTHIQQPQTAVRCASEVRNLVFDTCKLMNNVRDGGLRLELGGSDVMLHNTPLLEALLIDAGTVLP